MPTSLGYLEGSITQSIQDGVWQMVCSTWVLARIIIIPHGLSLILYYVKISRVGM